MHQIASQPLGTSPQNDKSYIKLWLSVSQLIVSDIVGFHLVYTSFALCLKPYMSIESY